LTRFPCFCPGVARTVSVVDEKMNNRNWFVYTLSFQKQG
jgi:hypothetical protein